MGTAADGILLSAMQSLFTARTPEDLRPALARSAWLVSRYASITLREINERGIPQVTYVAGERTAPPIAVEGPLTARVRAFGKTASTLDRFDDPRLQAVADEAVAAGLLCLVRPLFAYEQPVGILAVSYDDRVALDAAEFDALRRIAGCGAIALANARQRELLRAYAYSDILTGLANRRQLELELERLRGSELALLLIDFDGLKAVNDRLGYDRGDVLIREVGAALSGALRPGETAVRYGGDEFVLVMPRADAAEASARAEELTLLLERVAMPPDVAPLFHGASVGFAAAAADDDPAEVLRRAASAMHSHKRRRNGDRGSPSVRTAPTSGVEPT